MHLQVAQFFTAPCHPINESLSISIRTSFSVAIRRNVSRFSWRRESGPSPLTWPVWWADWLFTSGTSSVHQIYPTAVQSWPAQPAVYGHRLDHLFPAGIPWVLSWRRLEGLFQSMQDVSVCSSAFRCITRLNAFNCSVQNHALSGNFTTQVSIGNGLVLQLTWLPLHSFHSSRQEDGLSFCIAVLLLLQQPTQSVANFLKWTPVPVNKFHAVAGSVLQVSLRKILSLSVSVSHLRRVSLMIRPGYCACAGFAKLPNTFLKASSLSPSHRGPPLFGDFSKKMQCGLAAVLSLHFRCPIYYIPSTLSFFSRVCFTRSVKYWPVDDSQSMAAMNPSWTASLPWRGADVHWSLAVKLILCCIHLFRKHHRPSRQPPFSGGFSPWWHRRLYLLLLWKVGVSAVVVVHK